MKPINLNLDNFDAVVLPAPLAVVTFWSDWCGPCNDFSPKLRSLAKELDTQAVVARVNVDDYPELSKRFKVNGIPHTFIFKGGEQIDQCLGDVPYDYLKARVESALPKATTNSSTASDKQPKRNSLLDKLGSWWKRLFT